MLLGDGSRRQRQPGRRTVAGASAAASVGRFDIVVALAGEVRPRASRDEHSTRQ